MVVVQVDGSEDFLYFDADEVLAEFEGGAVEVFAVRLVGHSHSGESGVGTGAVDERGDQHAASAPSQARGVTGVRAREADDVLGRPVGIGQRDDGGPGRARGLQQQALGIDALEDPPAHGVDVVVGAASERLGGEIAELGRGARGVGADEAGEALAFLCGGARPGDRLPVCAQQVALDAGDHEFGQVALFGERVGVAKFGHWPSSLRNSGQYGKWGLTGTIGWATMAGQRR